MSITNPHSKQEWRQHLKQLALSLTPEWKQKASLQICASLESLLLGFADQDRFAIFSALSEEPTLAGLESHPKLTGRLAHPQIVDDKLNFLIAKKLVSGPFGVLQPEVTDTKEESSKDLAQDLAVILVPGLGFDLEGRRLGRGKAFYDKTLPSLKALKVGVCFSPFLVDRLPDEDHDVRMDMVVTEKRILKWK